MYAIALMAIAEVFVFARSSRATFDISSTQSPTLKAFLDRHPGDYRIFYERTPNIAMWLDKGDVWGYGQLMLKRYAEFMAFTQGQSPDGATQYLDISGFHPLHAMLRWRYAFIPGADADHILTANSVMSRLQLVHEYRVISGRDEIFQAMNSPSFDPRQQVILETRAQSRAHAVRRDGNGKDCRFVRGPTDRGGRSAPSGDSVDHGCVQQWVAGPAVGRQCATRV